MALKLSSRVKLVRELERSLLDECPPGVLSESDPHFADELKRRIDAYERGEDKGIPWELVRAKLGAQGNARKAGKRR